MHYSNYTHIDPDHFMCVYTCFEHGAMKGEILAQAEDNKFVFLHMR
jgi:hypothetical protein